MAKTRGAGRPCPEETGGRMIERVTLDRAVAPPEMAVLHADGSLFIGGDETFAVEEKVII